MPRITRVYTRTGDDGTTALGSGERTSKDSLRVSAYGDVDELNSALGVALSTGLEPKLMALLGPIQNLLFHLGADLCVPRGEEEPASGPCLSPAHVDRLEEAMDSLSETLEPLANFVLPGGTPGASQLHVCRTVCRRAERSLVALAREEPVDPINVRYLNRLSDCLFVMSRYENHANGTPDVLWDSRA